MSHLEREWAEAEVAPWRDFAGEIPAPFDTIFHFHIQKGEVTVNGDTSVLPPVYGQRVAMHVAAFQRAVRRFHFDNSISIAVDLRDEAPSRPYPCFSFQKKSGSKIILLPDALVDPAPDTIDIPYREKMTRGIFIGSTSGFGHLTAHNFECSPRVRAATAFVGRKDVKFRLPNVVQCDQEVLRLTRDDPRFSGGHISYDEQLRNKFIISMDGNGATCSRVTVALRSNSVLLKYSSQNELFYFRGLEPWRHYVPINRHSDVIETIRREKECVDLHAEIAACSSVFARDHLSWSAIEEYIFELFRAYWEMIASKHARSPRCQ